MQVRPHGDSGFHCRAVQGDEEETGEDTGEDTHPLVHGDVRVPVRAPPGLR